jgi:hypothetical protein
MLYISYSIMKKITKPDDERPEVAPAVHSSPVVQAPPPILRQQSHLQSAEQSDLSKVWVGPWESIDVNQELPKKVLDYDLKKMKSFKQKRKSYKSYTQEKVFLHDMKTVLDQYSPEEHQFDTELLNHVLNIAETFFIFGNKIERDQMKKDAVGKLMRPYFRNDADLLDIVTESIWHKVKKSTWMKRTFKRVRFFFLGK